MNYLTGLCVMVFFCAIASAKEPMLEWTLKYMHREISVESKEPFKEASNYRKHKKDFKEKLSVIIYTCGYAPAAAKASLGSMSLRLVLRPMEDGKMKVLGDAGPSGDKGLVIHIIDSIKEIRYGEEISLGGGGVTKRDKAGKRIGAEFGVFVLVVNQMEGDFSTLIRSNIDKKQEESIGKEELPPPKKK